MYPTLPVTAPPLCISNSLSTPSITFEARIKFWKVLNFNYWSGGFRFTLKLNFFLQFKQGNLSIWPWPDNFENVGNYCFVFFFKWIKQTRIRETLNLSTDANRNTNIIFFPQTKFLFPFLEGVQNIFFFFLVQNFFFNRVKRKLAINNFFGGGVIIII